MSFYVELDVSVKFVSICVVEANGAVIARGEVSSDPDQIAAFLFKHAPDAKRILHASGILSIWQTCELEKQGPAIICIDTWLAHKALSGRLRIADYQIDRFGGGFIGRKAAACFGGFADSPVQTLDGVGSVDELSHGWREGKERDDLLPGSPP